MTEITTLTFTNKGIEYCTNVTQKTVSGNQKQRICIARAVLLDAPIMILDEATASLDADSEKFIQNSIKELKNGRTMIIVAHRLSTIKNVDRIFVMKGGKIIEEGTHEELIDHKGYYEEFIRNQFR